MLHGREKSSEWGRRIHDTCSHCPSNCIIHCSPSAAPSLYLRLAIVHVLRFPDRVFASSVLGRRVERTDKLVVAGRAWSDHTVVRVRRTDMIGVQEIVYGASRCKVTHTMAPRVLNEAFSVELPSSSFGGEMSNEESIDEIRVYIASRLRWRPGQILEAKIQTVRLTTTAGGGCTHRRPKPKTIEYGSSVSLLIFPSLMCRSGMNSEGLSLVAGSFTMCQMLATTMVPRGMTYPSYISSSVVACGTPSNPSVEVSEHILAKAKPSMFTHPSVPY